MLHHRYKVSGDDETNTEIDNVDTYDFFTSGLHFGGMGWYWLAASKLKKLMPLLVS